MAGAVLTRWLAVVREGRWRWLAVHHAGVAAIVAGWAVRREPVGVVLNGGWLALATAWFLLGRRRRR